MANPMTYSRAKACDDDETEKILTACTKAGAVAAAEVAAATLQGTVPQSLLMAVIDLANSNSDAVRHFVQEKEAHEKINLLREEMPHPQTYSPEGASDEYDGYPKMWHAWERKRRIEEAEKRNEVLEQIESLLAETVTATTAITSAAHVLHDRVPGDITQGLLPDMAKQVRTFRERAKLEAAKDAIKEAAQEVTQAQAAEQAKETEDEETDKEEAEDTREVVVRGEHAGEEKKSLLRGPMFASPNCEQTVTNNFFSHLPSTGVDQSDVYMQQQQQHDQDAEPRHCGVPGHCAMPDLQHFLKCFSQATCGCCKRTFV